MLDRAISLFGVVDLCHGFFHGADIGIVAVHYFIGKSLAFVKNVVRLEYGFGARRHICGVNAYYPGLLS